MTCGNGILERGETCDDGNTLAGDCCAPDCRLEAQGSRCDDGLACTTGDVCTLGSCRGESEDPFCLPTRTGALACYQVGRARSPRGLAAYPAFEPREGLAVSDEFREDEPQTVDLLEPTLVCSAALLGTRTDPGALAGRAHYEAYRAEPATPPSVEPAAIRARNVGVETGLATAELGVTKLAALLEPSALAVGDREVAPPPADAAVRFKCYEAELQLAPTTADLPRSFAPTTLVATDVLMGVVNHRIGKPTRLCVPEMADTAAVGGAPPSHGGYLVCHPSRAERQAAGLSLVVSTANGFGKEVLQAERLAELCLPGLPWMAPPSRQPFRFLTGRDPVSVAMTTIWKHATAPGRTSSEVRRGIERSAGARQVLEQNLPGARDALLEALRELDATDVHRYASLAKLLEIVGKSPEVLAYLQGVLMAPDRTPARGHDPSPAELVRHLAMEGLAYHARQGDSEAKARVLDAARSPHPAVRAFSVRTYLGLERDRRRAQRDLAARLAPESQYLLWQE